VSGELLLLLAATVRSFAHMSLGLSDRNCFMSGRKLDAGYGLFVFRNGKLDVVIETLPKLFYVS